MHARYSKSNIQGLDKKEEPLSSTFKLWVVSRTTTEKLRMDINMQLHIAHSINAW